MGFTITTGKFSFGSLKIRKAYQKKVGKVGHVYIDFVFMRRYRIDKSMETRPRKYNSSGNIIIKVYLIAFNSTLSLSFGVSSGMRERWEI